MVVNFWFFLTICAVFSALLVLAVTMIINNRKVKELELEALQGTNIDINTQIEDTLSRHLESLYRRIETLEAIVLNKS